MSATQQQLNTQDNLWDIIIVGAGTAGIPCAIEAAKVGASRILVLEKSSVMGGTLHWTVGHLSAGGTERQAERGIHDSPEAHYNEVMRISNNTANPTLTKLATEEAPKTINWLASLGFPFDKDVPKIIHGHVPYTTARTHFANVSRGGVLLLSLLLPLWDEYVQKGAITSLLNHRLTEIVVENNAVCGVKAHFGGVVHEFRAKSIVLTTGGYAANHEMFQRVTPSHPQLFSTANPTSQGEGIIAAERIGARFHNAELHNISLGGIETVPNSGRVDYWDSWAMVFTSQYRTTREVYVNEDGERFMNENEPSADVRERAVMKQKNWRFWAVFDERALLDSYAKHEPLVRQWLDAATFRAHAARKQYCWSAPTIRELANKCGLPSTQLEHSMKGFTQAPFHALRINASSLISFGGLAVNGDLQVLNTSGEPIPNLFAAGEILGAAATSGNAFCGGMLITPALSFGRILGQRLGSLIKS